jgi:hypothetical protein
MNCEFNKLSRIEEEASSIVEGHVAPLRQTLLRELRVQQLSGIEEEASSII